MVTALNHAAQLAGLHPGMAATEAQVRVPGLLTREAELEQDRAALDRLARWALRRYSPVVAADGADGLAIDATGAAHLHGGEQAMLLDMVERLGRAGIRARAAVASTLGAAHALARHAPERIAVVEGSDTSAAIAELPIRALRLSDDTAAALTTLGFRSVGELVARPRAPFVRRFGQEFGRRLDQAFGMLAEPITPVAMPDVVAVERRFGEPISAAETLQRYTKLLAETLCTALEQRGLGARVLDLVFHRVDSHVDAVRVGTAKPSRDCHHLARLLLQRLDRVDPGFGVEKMVLRAIVAEPLGYRAVSTLGEEPAPDVSVLVDTLATRLGPERLYRLALVESDVPERSVQRVAALAAPTPQRWNEAWPRPSRLLDRPEPITTVALLPDHPPAHFTWRGTRHRVVRADGPERIFGEWWLAESETRSVRDYFVVEDEAGLRFWLFRAGDGADPSTGSQAWFLHGLFA